MMLFFLYIYGESETENTANTNIRPKIKINELRCGNEEQEGSQISCDRNPRRVRVGQTGECSFELGFVLPVLVS